MNTQTADRPASALGPDRFADVPLLDDKQAGVLRHFRNTVRQPEGDWSNIGRHPGNSLGGTSRYYLAHAVYAQAIAHYHLLPAAPGFFKADMDGLIAKMRHRDVWSYWLEMSASNPIYEPGLAASRTMWFDPVVKENIMYSGHLSAMVALYGHMFDDDKYDRMGSLRFTSSHLEHMNDAQIDQALAGEGEAQSAGTIVGFGGVRLDPAFVDANVADYNLRSLNDKIYWQMVESGFLGVACEPNQVFLACNLFPMIGFRYEDARRGTAVAEEVARGYFEAWRQRGMTVADGRYLFSAIRQSTGEVRGPTSPWTYSILNGINKPLASEFQEAVTGVMSHRAEDGTLIAYPTPQWESVRAARAGGAPDPVPVQTPDGFFQAVAAMYYAEIGDDEKRAATLAYLDKHASPTWRDGGFHYPWRKAQPGVMGFAAGSNAYAGYSRLNVKDGFHQLYTKPWSRDIFARPKLTAITDAFDVLRAAFLPEANTLVFRLRPYRGSDARDVDVRIANAQRPGEWTLTRNGATVASGTATTVRNTGDTRVAWEGEDLTIHAQAPQDTEFVLSWT